LFYQQNEEVHNFTLHKYYNCDQVKGDEMGGAYKTDGRDEKCMRKFGWETSREGTTRRT